MEGKKFGLKRLYKSFIYSISGLKFAICEEQNIWIHLFASVVVITMGIFFKVSLFEWIFIMVSIAQVISAELFNTAIEASVDLLSSEISKKARIAKDTASAAVLVFALSALIGGIIIFLPKILLLF